MISVRAGTDNQGTGRPINLFEMHDLMLFTQEAQLLLRDRATRKHAKDC